MRAEWPLAGGNVARTGVYEPEIVPPLKPLWTSAHMASDGIAISGHTVVCGFRGAVYGMDLQDGRERWRFEVDGAVMGTPLIEGERVYLGTSYRSFCLDLSSGEKIWETQAGSEDTDIFRGVATACCPLLYEGFLFFCDEFLTIVEPETGRVIHKETGAWDFGYINIGAAASGHHVYFPRKREVLQIDLAEGVRKVAFSTINKVCSGPVAVGDKLLYGTMNTVECAIPADGEVVWEFLLESEAARPFMLSRPACSGGRVFFGAIDRNIYAVDLESGERIWKHTIDDTIRTSPLISGGAVYVAGPRLLALDEVDGSLLWEHDIRGVNGRVSSPAAGADILVVGGDRLYAFEPA